MAHRRPGRPRKPTVAEATESFLRSKSLRATPHYIATITGFMRYFVDYYGHRTVSSLSIDDMEEYAVYLQNLDVKFAAHPRRYPVAEKLSKTTIDSHHRTLRAFFNWLIKRPEYGVKANPMLEVPRPRIFDSDVRIKRVEWLTYKRLIEAARTLEGAAQKRALAILYMLPDTGCRAAGLCGLKWADVDLAERRAHVVEKFGKGRYVWFLVNTRRQLEEWKKHAPKSEYVFCSIRPHDLGQALTPSGLYQILTDLSRRAKLERDKWVSPHDLRHMFATYADEKGIPIAYLQALMGHERAETTARYIHRSGEALRLAHDKYSPLLDLLLE
jgi:integrase